MLLLLSKATLNINSKKYWCLHQLVQMFGITHSSTILTMHHIFMHHTKPTVPEIEINKLPQASFDQSPHWAFLVIMEWRALLKWSGKRPSRTGCHFQEENKLHYSILANRYSHKALKNQALKNLFRVGNILNQKSSKQFPKYEKPVLYYSATKSVSKAPKY